MEKAKAAVSGFLSKDGRHDTTVHEVSRRAYSTTFPSLTCHRPAVTSENVTHTHHENVQTPLDRELHQDHHHTTVQPIPTP